VDVHIEATPGANKLVVMGQLLDCGAGRPGRGSRVTISNLAGTWVQTVTNEFGEFRKRFGPAGDLELKLLAEGRSGNHIAAYPLAQRPDTVTRDGG